MEEPDQPNCFRLHAFDSKHKHPLNADIPIDMHEYFQRKKSKRFSYRVHGHSANERRDWKGEFMKSLTYELTTIYADQMAQ